MSGLLVGELVVGAFYHWISQCGICLIPVFIDKSVFPWVVSLCSSLFWLYNFWFYFSVLCNSGYPPFHSGSLLFLILLFQLFIFISLGCIFLFYFYYYLFPRWLFLFLPTVYQLVYLTLHHLFLVLHLEVILKFLSFFPILLIHSFLPHLHLLFYYIIKGFSAGLMERLQLCEAFRQIIN